MVFAAGKAVALATNHVLNISAQINEERTKDDAIGPVGEFDYADWDVTIDSVLGSTENVSLEQTYESLIGLQLAGTEVDVVFGAVPDSEADKAVPEDTEVGGERVPGGWHLGVTGTSPTTDFPSLTCGKGIISEVSINAPESGNATVSTKIIAAESF